MPMDLFQKGSAVPLKMVKRRPGQPTRDQLSMLERIATVAGGELFIDQVGYEGDPSWVRFHIAKQLDAAVLRKLDRQEHRLYGPQERVGWQITCPSVPSGNVRERGLWLHKLDTPAARSQYQCGCWFY